jgi:hypothetical protein
MTGPRPSAPENPRSRAGHSPAIDRRNAAAAARAAAQLQSVPAVSGGIPGYENMSFAQQRLAQDRNAARRAGR